MTPTKDNAMLADRIESHVRFLANTRMEMPLGAWNAISNDLLSAATALRSRPTAATGGGVERESLTAKQAMTIGMEIAEKHKDAVLQLVAMAGSAPIEQALHGNLVWLASQIMIALQNAAIASTPSQAVQTEAGRPLAAGTREEIARIVDPDAINQCNDDPNFLFRANDARKKADAILSLASAATRTGE